MSHRTYCGIPPIYVITQGTVNLKTEILGLHLSLTGSFLLLVYVTNPPHEDKAEREMSLIVIHDDNLKVNTGDLNGLK